MAELQGNRRWIGGLLLVTVGYFLLYLATDRLGRSPSGDLPIWDMAPAISLMLLISLGPRWFLPTFVAPILAGLIHGSISAWTIVGAGSESVACLLGAVTFRAAAGRRLDIAILRNVAFLLGAVAIAAAGIAAADFIEVVVAHNAIASIAVSSAAKKFVAAAVAMLSLTPLAIERDLYRPASWRGQALETVLQFVALGLIAWEVFVRSANSEMHYFYLLFLPVAWITIRHGQPGAALALALTALAAVVSGRILQHGALPLTEQQVRLAALAVTALLLGVMVSERRASQERLIAQQNELAHFQRLNIGWEMASALGHELNQPLSAAMNYCQAALRQMRAASPDLQLAQETLSRGIDQVEQAGQTIHGLRNFMRKHELRFAPTKVGYLVNQAFRLVSAEAYAANVTLSAGDLAGFPAVMVDHVQIVQVLVNLLRNSVQAVAEAGMAKGAVTVTAEVVEGSVAIGVVDTGPGLAADIAERLFEPFTTSKTSGMGLGLAISKSIIKAHGGEMRIDDLFKGGAAFVFTLPVAREETSHG
ncbi:MAG: ATP-binding protein [Hyphomicrobium sp.]|jgi:C4-dicarboxylate-specific signal transduction histidine kinase